jgi:hypothetical protein
MSDIMIPGGRDPFAAYAAAVAPPQGQYMRFSKGEWLFGSDKLELSLGSRFAANMNGLQVGWICWKGGQPVERRMNLLIDMVPVPSRASLGDTDEGLWELGDRGEPRDPWAFTNELQLMSPDGDLYIYSTASDGGKRDLGRLCGAYTEGLKQHPGQVPVVTLGRGSYDHKIKLRGKIWVPVLNIVDWTDESVLAIAAPATEAGEDDDIPFEDDAAAFYQQQKDRLAAHASAGAKKADALAAAGEPVLNKPVRRGAKF